MEGVVMMKVLFGNDIEPTEIKNENLFNRMTRHGTWKTMKFTMTRMKSPVNL